MGLPLQPTAAWWRQSALRGVLTVTIALAGLGLLGWLGLTRRPPSALIITGPHAPMAYPRAAERLIAGAVKRIWLMQYVIRAGGQGVINDLLLALVAARQRGVEVCVGLDQGLVYGTTDRDPKNDAAAAWLTAHGITVVWDEKNRTSHAKILLVDDQVAIIGSHNWTRAALTDNREVSVLITDGEQLAQIRELIMGLPGWPAASR
jgi:phosphatidylserine/phosphatidylglycerophosphate/cardiolipin synthase-like enzyme